MYPKRLLGVGGSLVGLFFFCRGWSALCPPSSLLIRNWLSVWSLCTTGYVVGFSTDGLLKARAYISSLR